MMASNNLSNVAWTAPSLIAGGLFLQRRCGSQATFKIFLATIAASYLATTCMGPTTFNSQMNVRAMMPMRWDCIDSERGEMCGADIVAGTCLYACLFSCGLWYVGIPFACFDAAYYGPQGLAMPATASIAALTML